MNQSIRNNRYFSVSKNTAATQLGIPDAIDWSWDGQGLRGLLLARRPDVPEPGIPLPGITRITERWVITPFADIYAQWFAAYPPDLFSNLEVSFTSTNILFHLNREESA